MVCCLNVCMKKFTINIPEELHRRFRIACTLEGKDMTASALELMEEFIEKVEKRKLIVVAKKK